MYKVVIVDDEKYICHLISKLIDWNQMGLEIAGMANDSHKALEIIKEVQPDIIISDVQMPNLNGLQMIEQIREILPDTSVIFVSGYSEFEFVQEAIRLGADDYLLKPIRKKDLITVLERILPKKEANEERKSHYNYMTNRFEEMRQKMQQEFVKDICDANKGCMHVDYHILNERYMLELKNDVYLIMIIKADANVQNSGFLEHVNTCIKMVLVEILENYYFIAASLREDKLCVIINSDVYEDIRSKAWCILQRASGLSLHNSVHLTIGLTKPVYCNEDIFHAITLTDKVLYERYLLGTDRLIETGYTGEYIRDFNPVDAAVKKAIQDSFLPSVVFDVNSFYEQFAFRVYERIDKGLSGFHVYEMYKHVFVLIHASARICMDDAVIREIETVFEKRMEHAYSVAMLTKVIEEYHTSMLKTYKDAVIDKEKKPIRDVKKYIQIHYMNQITLADVADYTGYNQTYFSNLFQKETGQSFTEYLIEIRINKAKEKLRDHEKTAEEISYEVGYNNPKYFYRIFKKTTGLTVKQYRELFY